VRTSFTAVMAFVFVSRYLSQLHQRSVVLELERNLNFVAVVVAVLLWIALPLARPADQQFRILVAALGLSAALQASAWVFLNRLPFSQSSAIRFALLEAGPFGHVAMLFLWCFAIAIFPTPRSGGGFAKPPELIATQARVEK